MFVMASSRRGFAPPRSERGRTVVVGKRFCYDVSDSLAGTYRRTF
jgi:hypothetical protein